MFFPRKIYPAFRDKIQTNLITGLLGMKRTGKTALVKQALKEIVNKNSLYLSLRRPDNREIFERKNYEAIRQIFINRGLTLDRPMVVALDDVEQLPNLTKVIGYLTEHHQIKFVLVGSRVDCLGTLVAKPFELWPLDWGEYLGFKNLAPGMLDWRRGHFSASDYDRLAVYYEEYISWGGFPQVVLAGAEIDKRDLLLEIIAGAEFSKEKKLYSLVKLLAGLTGERIEISQLARLSGLSRPTVTSYLKFLENNFLIKTVPVYTSGGEQEIVKAKKLYFSDSGLVNVLGELSGEVQFKNTVYQQLAGVGKWQYYALKTGQEIDLVQNGKLAVSLIERPTGQDINQLNRLSKKAGMTKFRLIGRYPSPQFNDYAWGGEIV